MFLPSYAAETTIVYTGSGTQFPANVVLAWDVTAFEGDPEELGLLMSSYLAGAPMKAVLSTSMAATSVRVKFGPRDTGPSAEVAISDAAGTLNMERGGAQVSFLSRKVTALGGRRGSGRTYWPWGGEGSLLVNSVWSPTFLGLATTALDTLLTGMAGADVYPLLLHSDVAGDPPVPLPPTPVTGWVPQSVASTQRRRLRR